METTGATRRIHRSIAVLAVAITAGCATDAGSGAEDARAVVRDSAGITIVENRAPLWAPGEGWRLGIEPHPTIGMLDGAPAYIFSAPQPHLLSDGRILVAEFGHNELRYFSADGEHLRTAGGAGDGPGEFARLSQVNYVRVFSLDRGGHARREH